MASLTFKRFSMGPFQGIDERNPIIIEFPKVKAKSPKRPIVKFSGDQERGKSSLINALLYGLRHELGFKKENFVNKESKTMQGEYEFESEGHSWKVRFTKTKFELFRLMKTDDDQAWIPQGEIDRRLRQLIGNVAVSPMKLRTDDGKKQVEWLFDLLNVPQAILIKAQELSTRFNTVVSKRSEANKQYEILKNSLSEDPLYINWDTSAKKYAERKTTESVVTKLSNAEQRKNLLVQMKEKLNGVIQKISDKTTEIGELEKKLQKARGELTELQGMEVQGNAYIEKNGKVEQEYVAIQKEFIELSQYITEQGQWDRVKQSKKEMDEYEELVQRSDTIKATLKREKRKLLQSVLPQIDGLEVITDDDIDGPKPGVYLHGKNPVQLSESELFDMYLKLCEAIGVTMVFIENITSFGTRVVDTLNTLSKAGVYVWATEMRRGQDELKIEFIDTLE